MSSYTSGWRLSLRLARREALRHRGRSLLVLLMIALPVAGVVAASVLIMTTSLDTVESLDRRMGSAAAGLVTASPGAGHVQQGIDPDEGSSSDGAGDEAAASIDDVLAAIGDRPVLELRHRWSLPVTTDKGRVYADATALDAGNPLASGLFDLTAGRWPTAAGEVTVNAALAARGPGLGERLTVPAAGEEPEATYNVVGIAESASRRSDPVVTLAPGGLGGSDGSQCGRFGCQWDSGESSWLVGGEPITWPEVVKANLAGALVLSRSVAQHPPAEAVAAARQLGWGSSDSGQVVAIAGLVVSMALLEVVLLAGPAFAVGARQQQRSLALMAASGGTPAQARRTILAGGLVLGTAAALLGVAVGVLGARAAVPILQRFVGDWLGPFQVVWWHLAVVGMFGVLSAVLACVVPAWIASRSDVVAVLAGRRGEGKPSLVSPLIGILLLAGGFALAVLGAKGKGELLIAASALVCVIGMLFLVPVVVAAVARLGRWLPLTLRFATRDAARHRTRTTPAVAAVAATVAGVVALGISTGSDQKENRETYTASLPMGDAMVTYYDAGEPDWDDLTARIQRVAPGVEVDPIAGTVLPVSDTGWSDIRFVAPGTSPDVGGGLQPMQWGGSLNSQMLVSDGPLSPLVSDVPGLDGAAASAILARGGVVVFYGGSDPGDLDQVDLWSGAYDDSGQVVSSERATVPALLVDVGSHTVPATGVISSKAAAAAGIDTATVGLYLPDAGLSGAEESDVREVLQGAPTPADIYVERGYQPDVATRIVQWVLAAIGAVLMLGGTLTATFLALSDARPDLATLAAVGAAPRTRRGVAAAYALSIGLVGAVLGALVGAVPGLAIAVPLTSYSSGGTECDASGCRDLGAQVGPFFDVPWLMVLTVVIGLPLLVALVVGLFTRSRLPMVARLD